jgi:NADH-quinone oxidoreductase subunit M
MVAFYLAFGWWVILPALTLIVTAAYYLWSIQRTLFEGGDEGELPESLGDEKPVDITWHENCGMFILAAMSALIGIMPFLFFDMMSGYADGFFGEAAHSILEILNSLEVRP